MESNLENLNISMNEICNKGFEHVEQLIRRSKLKNLNVSKNSIGKEGVVYIERALED